MCPGTALIENEYLIFPVDVWCTTDVENLKKVIQSERAFLKDVDPQKELWKVNIDVDDLDGLKEKVDECILDHGQELTKCKTRVSDYWSDQPRKGCHLDIIEIPDLQMQMRSRKVIINLSENFTWISGQNNTRIIYQVINSERLVQVRGALRTGKTTHLKLLQSYILQVEPDAKIRTMSFWPSEDRCSLKRRLDYMLPGVLDERPEIISKTYILVDNGQHTVTFWDGTLWNEFFGDHQQRSKGYRIIIFCT